MFLRSLILASVLAGAPGGLAAEGGVDYRWPAGYEGAQRLDVRRLEASDGGGSGFETEGFRFYADAEIADRDWRSIMVVCEGLRGALRSLPLGLVERDADGKRGVVRIFSDAETYREAGGLAGTVGIFLPRTGEVLIWAHGLEEPDPERGRFRLQKSRQYDLLVHELTHQATRAEFRRMPVWLSEGVAEYMAAAHFAPGRYSFKDPTGSIRAHVTKYLGEVTRRDRFAIVPLRKVMALDGQAWEENTLAGTGHGPYLKYVSALLLVHYFCHLDPARNHGEVLRKFFGALREGRSASRATVEELLRGRSSAEIEEEIEKFWRERGLRIEFRE